MKAVPLFCCLALALAWRAPVRAEDPPDHQQLPPPGLRFLEEAACTASPMHVYGGGVLKFKLVMEAPLGTRTRVVADLFQSAAKAVAAPLERDVPVTPVLSFEDRTYVQADCLLPALPAVRRKTTMLLKLRAADAVGSAVSRNLVLIVYPAAEPDAWMKTVAARLARSGLRRLAVFGEGTALRQFLRSRKVVFGDLGEDWPGEPDTQTLYLGETRQLPPAQAGDLTGVRLVLFQPEADEQSLPPGVYQSSDARGGTFIKVMLPALLAAPGDNPAAQAALDEIFRRALEPRATSETTPDPAYTP